VFPFYEFRLSFKLLPIALLLCRTIVFVRSSFRSKRKKSIHTASGHVTRYIGSLFSLLDNSPSFVHSIRSPPWMANTRGFMSKQSSRAPDFSQLASLQKSGWFRGEPNQYILALSTRNTALSNHSNYFGRKYEHTYSSLYGFSKE
jgi:hypothetical protein